MIQNKIKVLCRDESSLLTSPCLRRPHSHTLTLLHWTAPSPPPVKGGSWEGRGEAWGRVVQEAEGQTEETQQQALAYKRLRVQLTGFISVVFANVAGKLCLKRRFSGLQIIEILIFKHSSSDLFTLTVGVDL